MTQVRVSAELQYEVRQPTVFLFNVCAEQSNEQQVSSEAFETDPSIPIEGCRVGIEGCRLQRVQLQPCQFRFAYTADVVTANPIRPTETIFETPVAELPPEVLPYLNPSRYCQSDLLARFAFEEFGSLDQDLRRVWTISDWVGQHLEYTPGSTGPTTTASDVLVSRQGVCRDYAHLAISCCRGVGVPARYVSAYAVGVDPPDFHGMCEAYVGGRWWPFDPTGMADLGAVARIGAGRDAADLAFATITGDASLIEKHVAITM